MTAENAPKMPENAQIFEIPDPGISAAQLRAIEMLLSGVPVTKAARQLGIARRTLFDWRKNPVFQAELNRRTMEASEAMDQRLRRLSEKAADVVEKHLNEGNLQAATALLRLAAARPRPTMETEPQQILKHTIEQEAQKYLLNRPFDDKRIGPLSMKGQFADFCGDMYDYLVRKYGIERASAFAEILDEMNSGLE